MVVPRAHSLETFRHDPWKVEEFAEPRRVGEYGKSSEHVER